MTTLHNILQRTERTRFATKTGREMHRKLQRIVISDTYSAGDQDLIERICATPHLAKFFSPLSRTEVPIAGTINNRFISRRIDRMITDDTAHTIMVLDYKTDVNPDTYRQKYIDQVNEYVQLLHAVYPNYEITGYILWTHDFLLEKLPDIRL